MSKVMICMGFADGSPCDTVGQYLERYEPNWNSGLGQVWWTKKLNEARKFKDAREAVELWNMIPNGRPLRPDKKPNKPLTAYHVEIVDYGEVL